MSCNAECNLLRLCSSRIHCRKPVAKTAGTRRPASKARGRRVITAEERGAVLRQPTIESRERISSLSGDWSKGSAANGF